MLTEPNQRATTVKDQDIIEIVSIVEKAARSKMKIIKTILETKIAMPIPSNPSGHVNNLNNHNKNSNRAERKPKTVYPPCETCGKTNHSTEECYKGANAANRPPPRQRRPERQNQVQKRANQNDSKEITQAAAQNLN